MPMDFFEHQDAARRKSGLLVFYFAMAVILIVAAIYLVTAAAFLAAEQYNGVYEPPDDLRRWWNLDLFVWVAGGTLAVILAGSLFRIATLRSGGQAVAEMLGARRVDPDTTDVGERKLINVVEEMALASGTPVPPVYVMDHEQAINAFAAGYAPGDAVVAVTRGTLDYLTRDELQGVVAHEFSHILHGDMRLNIRLIGILHGILLIALIGYVLVRGAAGSAYRRSSRRDGGAGGVVVLGAALVIIGYVGVFFGKLIKAAVSRQREYLADASAVQYTRNPEGIAGALKKIGGLARGARVEAAHAEEASHMFFGNALTSWFSLLSTHPPLEDRIRRVDPSFDGRFPRVQPARETEEQVERPAAERRRPAARAFPGAMAGAMIEGAARVAIPPQEMIARIGELEAGGLAFAAALLESLPDPLRRAVHNPFGARAVVYGLLLDRDEEMRRVQLERLAEHADPQVYEETRRLSPLLDRLQPSGRVPLIELALPSLRNLSANQYRTFRDNVDHLVKADKKIQLFEYVLQRMLMRHLEDQFTRKRPPSVQYYAIRPLLAECAGILSTLAHMGHADPAEAARAFKAGAVLLNAGAPLELKPRGEAGLRVVDQALKKLEAASPQIKKRLLTAATACIATDGKVTVAESELLRAIADSLDCPMPPLVPGQTVAEAAAT